MTKRILNIGSINIDHVYRVPHFVQAGETLASIELSTGLGGKGANQSVAVASAGVDVTHVGRLSSSDQWALKQLQSLGVDVSAIELVDEPSGHAIIQLTPEGENAIVIHGGANQSFTDDKLSDVIRQYRHADFLLLQNETNLLDQIVAVAIDAGLKIALNPAPMTAAVSRLPLSSIDTLIVNQGEAQMLSNEKAIDDIIHDLRQRLPNTRVIITLGADGAVMLNHEAVTKVSAPTTMVVDTTGAGDTFVGYFLAGLVEQMSDAQALDRACRAAALAVTREGAINAIPRLSELSN